MAGAATQRHHHLGKLGRVGQSHRLYQGTRMFGRGGMGGMHGGYVPPTGLQSVELQFQAVEGDVDLELLGWL